VRSSLVISAVALFQSIPYEDVKRKVQPNDALIAYPKSTFTDELSINDYLCSSVFICGFKSHISFRLASFVNPYPSTLAEYLNQPAINFSIILGLAALQGFFNECARSSIGL
jgi:hypothetical protein